MVIDVDHSTALVKDYSQPSTPVQNGYIFEQGGGKHQ